MRIIWYRTLGKEPKAPTRFQLSVGEHMLYLQVCPSGWLHKRFKISICEDWIGMYSHVVNEILTPAAYTVTPVVAR